MSSKDRKFSSKEYSTKNRSSENENYETHRDKTHRKSSSKSRVEKTGDKNVEFEYKYKINESRDEVENEKRLKEEKRRRRVNDEVIKKENEFDRNRRNHSEKVEESYEEKRHHRRTNEDENVDRRKSKAEYKTEIDRTRDNENNEERRRHRREYEDDEGERRKKRAETKEDHDKSRQRIDKGDENNEERRRRRREYEDDEGEKRKKRTETKEDHDKSRHRIDKDDENNEERRRRKREYEDDEGEKRKKRTETKEDHGKSRQRIDKGDENNEERRRRRRENDENNDKRKTKESKEESEKAKQKNDKREVEKLKESEISPDVDERRRRSKKVESVDGEEDIYRKRRNKEKEKMALLDGVGDSVTSKMRSDGDRENEHKRRGHREDKESYESKSNRKSSAPINVGGDLPNYEDDFDNYDDEEFEEDLPGSSPVSNEPNATDQSSGISQDCKESGGKTSLPLAREEISKPPSTKPVKTNSSFINFRISQKKYSHDLVANRMLSRAYDLSRLIEMDKVEYDILEIAPVVEHSQYMKLFGKEGCQHEGSQTGSDNIARESQTEIIDERIVWTQCPPLDDNECFQIVSDSTESSASLAKIYNNEYSFTNDKVDNSYILALIIPTLTMIENILEEETTCEIAVKVSGSHDNSNKNNKQAISSGYNKYSISDGLDCLIARFAVSNSNMFVTVHQQSKSTTDKEQSKSFSPISVWKVSGNIGEPYMCLSCPGISETQSSIVCITFSPDAAASHIICGLSCGTIALWDLKDNKSNRKGLFPAYLTSVLSEENDLYHKGPIVALQPVNNDLSSTNSYQLISLDSWAQLVIWMVSIVNQQYNQWNLVSGSLIDLNLRPGSRYRMSKVTSICLLSNSYMTSMTLDPSCNTHLFCGTNSGQIIQHTRTNQSNPDNNKKNNKNNRSSAHFKCLGKTDQYESGAITQLDFYPFFEPYILAGYDDGLIEIFTVGKSQSLLSFHYKHQVAILQLKWSRSHPAIFFSFDVEGNLCVWNVLVDLYMPVHVQNLPGYIGFDLSSDSKWQTIRVETKVPNETRNVHNRPRLLLWALDGRVEVHELADAFSNPDLDVSFKTCSLFQSLI